MSRIAVFGFGPMRWEASSRLFALALRTWHFASTLAEAGHDVALFAIRSGGFEGWPDDKVTETRRGRVTVYSLSEHLCHENPGFVLDRMAALRPHAVVGVNRDPAAIAVNFARDLPFWADINGDPMAEAQVKARAIGGDWNINDWYRKLVPVLARADHFSTCSRAQRHALLAELGMIGRLTSGNDGYDFVTAIPNSVDDEELDALGRLPRSPRQPGAPFVLLWSGGYNTWMDPTVLFEALELGMAQHPELRFVSTGGEIPGHHLDAYRDFERRVARSRFRDRFELAGWVQTAELPAYYAGAHAAILVDRFSVEGVLGARTRSLDWLAAGLPIVMTRLSEISLELEAAGAALVAECGDAAALARAVGRLIEDPADAARRGQLGRALAQDRYRARRQLEPLLAWAEAPQRAPGLEGRVELEWKPGLLTSARTHATLVRSGISERGVAATAKSVGQAVFRKLKNRVGATSVRVLPSPAVDHETPPLASPRRAAFQWRELLAGVRDLPTLAVLVLVRPDTPPHVLRWTLEQLSLQYFDEFSVVVAETGNTPPALAEALQQATQTLKRVDAVHVRDVDVSHHHSLATSDYVVALAAGTLLRPDTLAELVWTAHEAAPDVIYGDEQEIDETNVPTPEVRKPDWSRDLLLSRAFMGPVVCCRSAFFELDPDHVARWQSEAIVHETFLKATERTNDVFHLPLVLALSWRSQHDTEAVRIERARQVGQQTLEATRDTLWRVGANARAERGLRPGLIRVRHCAPSGRAAIVMLGPPSERCLSSLRRTCADVEIAKRIDATDARWLVLVDSSTEAFQPGWLEALLEELGRDGVAAVSPKLLHPNGATAWAGDAGETPWLGNVAHEVPLPSAFCVALPRSLLSGRNVPREPAARAQWLARRAIRWYEKGQRALYTPFSALFVHAAHVMKDNERPEHARGLDAE